MTHDSIPAANALRRPAAEFPAIVGLTLLPHGVHAALVNISTTGLLAESTARLTFGSPVIVQFRGTFQPSSVVGRVVRCEVAAMGKDGLLRYGVAIEFATPIPLDGDAGEKTISPEPGSARNRW